MQSFFNNKGKVEHLSCVIYKDVCHCGSENVNLIWNEHVNLRWNEHESKIDKPLLFKVVKRCC